MLFLHTGIKEDMNDQPTMLEILDQISQTGLDHILREIADSAEALRKMNEGDLESCNQEELQQHIRAILFYVDALKKSAEGGMAEYK